MKREASKRLDCWLADGERKPLVLRGARQVGKTWLVRDLAARKGLDLVELNFERRPELGDYFLEKDPVRILRNVSADVGRPIEAGRSLLFLDEIQAVPSVFASLRWFREELSELPVVAAGSLLDFVLADHSFSMPVGRISYQFLEPLSFFEFVRAEGNEPLYDALCDAGFEHSLPDGLHEKCVRLYRDYCLCGGMPEVVNKWLTTRDGGACLVVQRDLIATFLDDFSRHGREAPLLRKTLYAAAEQLGGKFVMSRVEEGVRAQQVRKGVDLLCLARCCRGCGIPVVTDCRWGRRVMNVSSSYCCWTWGWCRACLG